MKTKKKFNHNVYFKTPYSVEDLKKIDTSVDDYFSKAVLDDYAKKYVTNGGFTPKQIQCIGIALNRVKALSEPPIPPATQKPLVAPPKAISVESVTLSTETSMNTKTTQFDPDDFTGLELRELKKILSEKFKYTPKATISGIVEKDSSGVWRETCLRNGQGSKKNEICRKQEHQFRFNGKIIRMPLAVLAYFLQSIDDPFYDGEFLQVDKVREKLENGHVMSPYNTIKTRKPMLGKAIEL